MDKKQIVDWRNAWVSKARELGENSGLTDLDLLTDFANEFVPKWESVETRLPTEHRRYLCIMFNENCFIEEVCLFEYSTKKWLFEKDYVFVTHWQPLPTTKD